MKPSWTIALRGIDDALLEARALFGPPITADIGAEVHHVDLGEEDLARAVLPDILARCAGAAVALSLGDDGEARLAAVALAAAAQADEVLLTRAARDALAPWWSVARGRCRKGWRLPIPAFTLSAALPTRDGALSAERALPAHPPFVGRAAALAQLDACLRARGVVALRGGPGCGATRFVTEAAARHGARLARRTVDATAAGDVAVLRDALLTAARDADWLYVECHEGSRARAIDDALDAVVAAAPALRVLVRAPAGVGFDPRAQEVELGPLDADDVRALVRGMLGDVDRAALNALGGKALATPRAVVERVRDAVATGRVARQGERWTLPPRRPLRVGPRAVGRLALLPPRVRRALAVAWAVGDGVPAGALEALLRAVLGEGRWLDALIGHGFATAHGGEVDLSRAGGALAERDPALAQRAAAWRAAGVIDALRGGDFAAASRRALSVEDLAVALRLASGGGDAGLRRALASRVGAAATLSDAQGTPFATGAIDAPRATEDDPHEVFRRLVEGVDRLPAEAAPDPGSVRGLILRAVHVARRGAAVEAVRVAVHALARARREGDAAGERASLALIAGLLGVLGEGDGARVVLAALDAP